MPSLIPAWFPLRAAAAAAAGAMALLLAAAPAGAAPVQISGAGIAANGMTASVSDDGKRIAFYSSANLTGANADGSFEVYLYDRPSNTMTQVSNFAGGHMAGGNQVPVLSGDGNRLSYQHFEISGGSAGFRSVVYDHQTGASVTVTPSSIYGETNELARDGKTLLVATGNGGLRRYDVEGGTLAPVYAGNTLSTAMSRDGRLVAMELYGSLVLRDLSLGTTESIVTAGGYNMGPDLSDNGRWLAFTSTYDPLGTNADRNAEVFYIDLATHAVRQITNSTGDAFTNRHVSLSADGSRMAFSSSANLLGDNADGNEEVFLFDALTGLLRQVTDTTGDTFNFEATLSGDGLTLAYTSNADHGSNPRHLMNIFVEDLAATNSVPEPSTLALLLLAAAALVLSRRRAR